MKQIQSRRQAKLLSACGEGEREKEKAAVSTLKGEGEKKMKKKCWFIHPLLFASW
jgi:hypothetical protein